MYRFGMTILIVSLALWASVIILALYEWQWLVAGLLLFLVLLVWPEGKDGRRHWRNILPRSRE